MILSDREVKLCEAYERLGRDDLALCVKNARVYQLLDGFVGTDFYTNADDLRGFFLGRLHAMQRTLDPSCSPHTSSTIPQWINQMLEKHNGDQGLAVVKELDQQNSKARKPSKVIYPVKKFLTTWMR